MVEKKDHENIRRDIAKLPEGTKEQAAWEQLGLEQREVPTKKDGKEVIDMQTIEKLPRHIFRDLWLEIRVPTQKKPEAEKPVNPSKTPAKPPETP